MRHMVFATPRRRALAALLGAALFAAGSLPASAQMIYMPSQDGGYRTPSGGGRMPDSVPDRRTPQRMPERIPEPRRPHHPPVYPGGGGIGVIVGPPPVIYGPPPEDYYDAPPPRERAQKPSSKKPVAKKPPASRPPAKPSGTARAPAPPPAVAAQEFVPDEVVFELRPDVPPAQIAAVMQRFALTPIAQYDLALLGTRIQHARIPRGSNVPAVVRQLAGDPRVASAQPNFLFTAQADGAAGTEAAGTSTPDPTTPGSATPESAPANVAATPPAPEMAEAQYAPARLKAVEAHKLGRGAGVLVAVIDSGVDPAHPELEASLLDSAADVQPHSHGTGMAGAIAAHAKLVGIAPEVRVLALDALKYDRSGGGRGTTIDIVRALDTAARRQARVVNLSFAGPRDELMARALRALDLRGAVLVAAAGNAGPKSKPLYPAAHPDVIAVTATDAQDALYKQANIGPQVALAAPGVEILVPAPGGAYQVLSGTSLACAHVSGVVALMLERNPSLSPEEVRSALVATARDLGRPGRDDLFGAGLVDAVAALAGGGEGHGPGQAAVSPEAVPVR